MQKIKIEDLPLVLNVCNQLLREVYKNEHASLAHVEVLPGATSLLHNHTTFTEWYYILEGEGIIEDGKKKIYAAKDALIILSPGEQHKLTNISSYSLSHLVFSTPPFNPDDVHVLEERQ